MSDLIKLSTMEDYVMIKAWLDNLKATGQLSAWEEAMRHYALHDLFFFVNFISTDRTIMHSTTGLPLYFHKSYLDMCQSVQWAIDNCKSTFDGSARRGGKSTIRTKNASIQMGLRWPDISIGIFSVEKQLAKRHVKVIKEEIESNTLMKVLFHDRLWDDPQTAAKNSETTWSIDEGLRFKRSRPRANQTIEHNAFFGSSPTGSGYDVIHFDDCEDGSVVNSQANINKLHDSFASAVSLTTPAVLPMPIIFVTNTFYHPEGVARKTYEEYKKEDQRLVRLVPAEDWTRPGDCPLRGTAVYPFTAPLLHHKFKQCKSKDEYAIQYCCDFTQGQDRSFQRSWIKYYNEPRELIMRGKNTILCLDCSKGIWDPMAGVAWACGYDKKLYWVDGFRKKLDPASPKFFDEIFAMAVKLSLLSDRLLEIRVEQMSQHTWAELIAAEMRSRGLYTPVIPCKGKVIKDRIKKFETTKLEREWQRWAPALQKGDVVFPRSPKHPDKGPGIPAWNEDGEPFDLVDYFLQYEYDLFPRAPHDDVLDAGALAWEPECEIVWPPAPKTDKQRLQSYGTGTKSWMSSS